jgi:hydrogenase maturation protease
MANTLQWNLLIIGYGNTLRSDDGVGPRVADAIAEMHWPGVETIHAALLAPELADPVSHARTVVFVDAAADRPDQPREVRLQPLEPAESSQIMAHAADPRTMLALSRDVFGHVPHAWWLTIPAEKMEFSEELTPVAARGCGEAVALIRAFFR